MNTQQTSAQFPTHIYPPPLLDSLGLVVLLKADCAIWEEIRNLCAAILKTVKAKSPIYSLPCLVGESIEDMLKFADILCWGDADHYTFPSYDSMGTGRPLHCVKNDAPAVLGFQYNPHEMRYEARRFCPVVIYRPACRKIDESFSFVLCAYTITVEENELQFLNRPNDLSCFGSADLTRRKLSYLHIENIS